VTWSEPVVVMDPAVTVVRYAAAAVKEPGVVAIAYYGSKDGVTLDGYVAESHNALDPAATFRSIAVNDPAEPLNTNGFESGYQVYYFNTGDGVEFVQVKYAPDGDIWASFARNMCPGGPDAGACAWDYAAHANSMFQGVVGRIVHR
jgi:hypothetical protein